MKIEIGESLGYSYLRHVKQCWLVQTNWKVSEHWDKGQTDETLKATFLALKEKFDSDGNVFKGTKNCGQFLKQGEIDVIGVGKDGSIHAMEVAFHEAGLNYGGRAETSTRVLKKLLRTMLILGAYHAADMKRHIYFVSPKVHRGVQQSLEADFALLGQEYPVINWHLMTNDKFTNELLIPTLEKTKTVEDSSELFARAGKLLEICGLMEPGKWTPSAPGSPRRNKAPVSQTLVNDMAPRSATNEEDEKRERGSLQRIVRSLMETLLEDHPSLLSESARRNLTDSAYCKDVLGLSISNLALLRPVDSGRFISGLSRYWTKAYGGQFYVVSQWWRAFHQANAERLLRFVLKLRERSPGHAGSSALERHERALRGYVG